MTSSSSGASSSLPPVITDYFEQPAFGKHFYLNKQATAVSYLMAIGAKCLILEEISDSTDSSSMLHEESNLWHKLLTDKLRLKMTTDGLWVQKKARNGRLRSLLITLKTNNKNDHFEWNSNGFFGPKSFLLKTLRSCTNVIVDKKSDESPQHRLLRTNSEKNTSMRWKDSDGSLVSTTYVSLVNDVRRLDLRLENDEITVIFCRFINRTYFM